jgi:hypothetical protein
MKRTKWSLSLVLALVAAVFISGIAFAGDGLAGQSAVNPEGRQPPGRRALRGEITGVDLAGGSFTLQSPDGAALTILVDENTRFRGIVAGLADLEPGQLAGVVLRARDTGRPVALLVFVPEHARPGSRFAGEVTGVTAAAGEFSLETRQRGLVTFQTDENTVFRGAVSGLDELAPGMLAVVAARPSDGDALMAVWVGVSEHRPVRRLAGEVLSVDRGASTFQLGNRQGEELTILVDGETEFRSQGGEVTGLSDLASEMHVIVGGHPTDEGFLARVVVVIPRPLPDFDLRVRGEITDVLRDAFSLVTPDGRTLTVRVDDQTRFGSRGGRVRGLADLAPGMQVLVGAQEVDGGYLAKVVLVADPQQA